MNLNHKSPIKWTSPDGEKGISKNKRKKRWPFVVGWLRSKTSAGSLTWTESESRRWSLMPTLISASAPIDSWKCRIRGYVRLPPTRSGWSQKRYSWKRGNSARPKRLLSQKPSRKIIAWSELFSQLGSHLRTRSILPENSQPRKKSLRRRNYPHRLAKKLLVSRAACQSLSVLQRQSMTKVSSPWARLKPSVSYLGAKRAEKWQRFQSIAPWVNFHRGVTNFPLSTCLAKNWCHPGAPTVIMKFCQSKSVTGSSQRIIPCSCPSATSKPRIISPQDQKK